MTEVTRLAAFVTAIEDERRLDGARRPTGASDESLDGVRAYLERAQAHLRSAQSEHAAQALEHVRYHVAESWSHEAELSTALLTYVSALQRALVRKG